MRNTNIPIKVNITGASFSPGDNLIFHDLYTDGEGELVLGVTVESKSRNAKIEGNVNVLK